jgi:MFS family permease
VTSNPRAGGRDRGNRPFAWLWWSQTVSGFGSQVTLIAIPLLAATTLKATAFDMGLLAAVETLPYLVFSIPAGALVDRADRRLLLMVTSLGRAAILMGIPAAALVGLMSMPVLYAVAFVLGTFSVVADVAHQSYVADLLKPDELLTGNQRLELSESAARTIGPGIGGALVGLLGGAVAVTVDALSYLAAYLLLLRSRPLRRVRAHADAEPTDQPALAQAPATGEWPVAMIVDVWDYAARLESRVAELERRMAGRSFRVRARGALTGFGVVRRDRVLRDMAASTATFNLASSSVIAIFVLYAATEAKLDAASIGWLMAAGNVGFVLGAIPVGAITRRLGVGRTLVISSLLGAAALVILPFAVGAAAVPLLFAGRFIGAFSIPLFNVNTRALRQSRAPREALGRVNAVFRLLDWGTVPIGALLGGGIGSLFGLRAALAVAAIFGVASAFVLLLSPLRRLKELDGMTPSSDASAAPASRLGPALRRLGTNALTALTKMPSIRWSGLAVGGALVQLMLFLPQVNARLGDITPWIYLGSSVAVLACVLRNARVPGLAIAAAGGACNLLAIVANGGAMPVSPEAARLVGHTMATSYTNTIELADPAFKLLTDIIAVPSPLPFANVYSIGDLLIVVGVLLTMAWAVHGSVARLKPADLALASA